MYTCIAFIYFLCIIISCLYIFCIVYDVCVYHSIYIYAFKKSTLAPASGAEVQPMSEDVLLHLNYTDWRNHFDGSASTGRGRLGPIVAQAG